MRTLNAIPAILLFAGAGTVNAQAGGSETTCNAPVDTLEGYGSGTTGGGSRAATTVTSCSALKDAVKKAGVIRVSGSLGNCGIIDLTSDTTIVGADSGSGLVGGGIRVKDADNVIIRNLRFIDPPKGENSVSLDGATYVWIDHNEFQNDGIRGDKDFYDGQLDITNGSDFVTVSWNAFLDHWKGSLIGHSASNTEDTGQLRVTYHHNWWFNVNSRTPSLSFGTGHIYSSCYENIPTSGLNIREGAKALIENNHFIIVNQAIVTNVDAKVQGFVTERNNIFYKSPTAITQKGHVEPPYSYTLDSASCVCDRIYAWAGSGTIKV